MGNEKVLIEFTSKTNEAQKHLAELQEYLNTCISINSDDVNWGNVGSMGYLLQELTELTDWAYKRGDYA